MNTFQIRKLSDNSLNGPYNINIIKAYIVANKLGPQDKMLIEGKEIPLLEVKHFHSLWVQKGMILSSQKPTESRKKQGKVVFFSKGRTTPPGPNPTYAGQLSKNPLVKILYRFMLSKQTGRIHFRQGRQTVDLFLEDGQLHHAASNIQETRLGEILVSKRNLNQSQVQQALLQANNQRRPLAQVIQEHKWVTSQDLKAAFDAQIKQRIFMVFSWATGVYRFYEKQITGSTFPSKVDILIVLKEGVLAQQSISVISNSLIDLQNRRVARLKHPGLDPRSLQLNPSEKRFYRNISNNDPLRDVLGETIEKDLMSEDGATRLLYLFWQIDLVGIGKELLGERTQKRLDKLENLIKQLKGQTHLQRLSLEGGANKKDIRQAYIKIAKVLHPDQLPPGTHLNVAKKTEEAFALIADAYRILYGK